MLPGRRQRAIVAMGPGGLRFQDEGPSERSQHPHVHSVLLADLVARKPMKPRSSKYPAGVHAGLLPNESASGHNSGEKTFAHRSMLPMH